MKQDEVRMGAESPASYDIFPGVTLTYLDTHAAGRHAPPSDDPDMLVIDYCHEGCIECTWDGQTTILGTGDVLVHRNINRLCEAGASLSPFRGIRLAVDLRRAGEGLGHMLSDLNISLTAIGEKYCACGQATLFRANASLIQTFSSLCNAPEALRRRYAKAKMPELILFLDTFRRDANTAADQRRFSRYAVVQTKAVSRYLTLHTGQQTTIADLSKRFCISQTVLKECFKRMYGESIASYSRRMRMEKAAELLLTTDLNILEIAMQVGYVNASKFSRGFRAVMGCNPNEYRRQMDETGSNSVGSEAHSGQPCDMLSDKSAVGRFMFSTWVRIN